MTDEPQVPATVDTVVEQPMDFTVIARDPNEMAKAQISLIGWAEKKIAAEVAAMDEVSEQLDIAVTHKWRTAGWKRQLLLRRGKIEFYRKIKAALEAGYYIVPAFPLEIFAIRTKRQSPDRKTDSWAHSNREQTPRLMPAGEGRYVSSVPEVIGHNERKDDQGKIVQKSIWWADAFQDVDFPFKLAKPEILTTTAQAMALRLFDQLGVLPDSRRTADPIVCGQIIDPSSRQRRAVTFIVAWWLDTSTL